MARGAGHDLSGLGDQIIAKLEEIYNRELQISNTTVKPKTDASGLEQLTTAAQKAGREIGSISKDSVKANKVTTLNNGTDDLKDREDRSE